MYVRPVVGEDHGLIRVLEGKLVRLTQRVPTLGIEHKVYPDRWYTNH